MQEENKKMSLYEYDRTIKELLDNSLVYDEETGEVFFTSEDLDNLNNSLDEKLNNLIGYVKDLQYEAEEMDAKAKAADEVYQKQLDNEFRKPSEKNKKKAESLLKYLDGYMKMNELKEIKKGNGTVKYSKSTICEIIDENKIKDWINKNPKFKEIFLKQKEPEISKKDIKDYLKEDDSHIIEGAQLTDKYTLKVK